MNKSANRYAVCKYAVNKYAIKCEYINAKRTLSWKIRLLNISN